MARVRINDPTLTRFRQALGRLYGNRLEREVLYGSRARGGARPDSDYNVAVFLRHMDDRGAELWRLADLSSSLVMKPATSCMPCPTAPVSTTSARR